MERIHMQAKWYPLVLTMSATLVIQFIVYAACNRQADDVPCYSGNIGDPCSSYSPNCRSKPYDGTVQDRGSRRVIQAVPDNAPEKSGRDNYAWGRICTYTCRVGPDCIGYYVDVEKAGEFNHVTVTGNECP